MYIPVDFSQFHVTVQGSEHLTDAESAKVYEFLDSYWEGMESGLSHFINAMREFPDPVPASQL